MKKVEIFENNNPLLKISIDATLEHSGDFSKCKHCIESENQSTKKPFVIATDIFLQIST